MTPIGTCNLKAGFHANQLKQQATGICIHRHKATCAFDKHALQNEQEPDYTEVASKHTDTLRMFGDATLYQRTCD